MMIMIAVLTFAEDNDKNINIIFFLFNYAWDIHTFGCMDLHYILLLCIILRHNNLNVDTYYPVAASQKPG